MIKVVLPAHLRGLARVDGEIDIVVEGQVTVNAILDAIEKAYPVLAGTMRDHATKRRRPFVRFFACAQDYSNEPAESPLPEAIKSGAEPFIILGAIAGG